MAFVNFTQGAADIASTTIAASAASHTATNHLFVIVAWDVAGDTVVSVADTALNSYSQAQTLSSGTTRIQCWYTPSAITGNATNIVTATISGLAEFRRLGVWQFSDFAGNSITWDTGDDALGTGTAVATTAETISVANEVIVAAGFFFSAQDTP